MGTDEAALLTNADEERVKIRKRKVWLILLWLRWLDTDEVYSFVRMSVMVNKGERQNDIWGGLLFWGESV